MAIATVPITPVTQAGVLDIQAIETAFDVTLGARVSNNGKVTIIIRNAGAGSHIVTIDTPKTVDGYAVANPPFVIAAGKFARLPLLHTDTFNNKSGANEGYITMTGDGTQSELKAVALLDAV